MNELDEHEWLFHVKLGFRTSSFRLRGFDFEALRKKTNECTPTLSASEM